MIRSTETIQNPIETTHPGGMRDIVYDQWLVLRCQGGDAKAFSELFQRWHPRLQRHARRLLDSEDDANDATQDAWLLITGGLPGLSDPALFRRWAYRIITRRCADKIRKLQRTRRSEVPAAMPEACPDSDYLIEHDEIDRLRAAIRTLPMDRRLVLSLLYTDLENAIEFWIAVGFELQWRCPEQGEHTHAGIELCDVMFMVALEKPGTPFQRQSAYIVVENVEACHARCKAAHPDETSKLEDFPYGIRDFNLIDPWGHFVASGEGLDRQPD